MASLQTKIEAQEKRWQAVEEEDAIDEKTGLTKKRLTQLNHDLKRMPTMTLKHDGGQGLWGTRRK